MLAQDDDGPHLFYLALLGWERLDAAQASYQRGVAALREAERRLQRSRGRPRRRPDDAAAGSAAGPGRAALARATES